MGSGIHKNTKRNIAKILDLLRETGGIHLRGIARVLNLNPFTVSNIISNYLDYFVEMENINQFGLRVKIIGFKPEKENTTLNDVLKYLEVKRKIKNI